MYVAQGWCALYDSPTDPDQQLLSEGVTELRALIERVSWSSLVFELRRVNGFWFLNVTCCANRKRGEADFVHEVLDWVANRLPGSYGLIYERDDDLPERHGNRFRVRVMARGQLTEEEDPFLSPARPVIED